MILIQLSITFVWAVNEIQSENKIKDKVDENSVKTKRGIHGYASRIGYPIYGQGFTRYTLTPGNAVVRNVFVNYPKVFRPAIPPPVLYHPKPILPIYANRYPVFVHRPPVIVQKPIVPVFPSSTSTFPPHIYTVNSIADPNVLPQPTLISQNGWKPIFQHTHINQQQGLPPLPTSSQSETPYNYYLPQSPSIQRDIGFSQSTDQYHQQQSQNDLQVHLQHLQQIQEIQHHQNFLRSEHNDGLVTSLSDQGYETASNNGRYSGPSSYDVTLMSRGPVN